MPARAHKAIFTFATTHQAMSAEDFMRDAGVPLQVVPPPRELTAGCGLALRVALQDVARATEVLTSRKAAWDAVYELGPQQEIIRRLEW